MAISDRPEFKAWLTRFEASHDHLPAPDLSPGDPCDGCGEPLSEPVSPTGLCLVCLAEQYGRSEGLAANRIAGYVAIGLALDPDTPIEAVRDALDEVLADAERRRAR